MTTQALPQTERHTGTRHVTFSSSTASGDEPESASFPEGGVARGRVLRGKGPSIWARDALGLVTYSKSLSLHRSDDEID
jgi:hypothetical protein